MMKYSFAYILNTDCDGGFMSGVHDPITKLIQNRQVYTARHKVEAIKAINSRVWGIEQRLTLINSTIAQADQLFAQGQAFLAEGNVTKARLRFKQVAAVATDHPEIQAKIQTTKEIITKARELTVKAAACLEEGNYTTAKSLISQAQQLDCGLPEASNLRQQLMALTADQVKLKTKSRLSLIVAMVLVIVTLISVIGVVSWQVSVHKRQESDRILLEQAQKNYQEALGLISAEEYTKADSVLRTVGKSLSSLNNSNLSLKTEIENTLHSPEMQQGLKGLVPFEGRWIKRSDRQLLLDQRKDRQQKILALIEVIQNCRDGKISGIPTPQTSEQRESLRQLMNQARDLLKLVTRNDHDAAQALEAFTLACDQAFVNQGLTKYKGQWLSAAEASDRQKSDAGLVKYQGEWVTPEVKEERENTSKGLVKYDGQWITPEEKVTREMTAQGFVKHNNEWVTPQVKEEREMTAKGFVRRNGKWITREEFQKLERAQEIARIRLEQARLRRALPTYSNFVIQAKIIQNRFDKGMNLIVYTDKLKELQDAYSEIRDQTSQLKKKADLVINSCNLVRTTWILKLDRYSTVTDSDVSRVMSLASDAIADFLKYYETMQTGAQ